MKALIIPFLLAGAVAYLALSSAEGQEAELRREPPQPLPTANTLAEARAMVAFDLNVPSDLPQGFEFLGARHRPFESTSPTQSNGPLNNAAGKRGLMSLYYGNQDSGANFMLMLSTGTIRVVGLAEPIDVNGVKGEIIYGESFDERPRPGYVTIQWTRGDMSYSAASTLSAEWTLDQLLQALDSIP